MLFDNHLANKDNKEGQWRVHMKARVLAICYLNQQTLDATLPSLVCIPYQYQFLRSPNGACLNHVCVTHASTYNPKCVTHVPLHLACALQALCKTPLHIPHFVPNFPTYHESNTIKQVQGTDPETGEGYSDLVI